MAFEPDFLQLMSQTFTHKPKSATNGFGGITTGTPLSGVPCHVTYELKIVRGDAEESANSTAQIQFPPPGYSFGSVTVPEIGIEDHVVLADGIERRVLDTRKYVDEDGVHHQSAMLT